MLLLWREAGPGMAGKQASFRDGVPSALVSVLLKEGLGPPTPSVQLLRWRGRTLGFTEGFLMGSPPAGSGRTLHQGTQWKLSSGEFLKDRTPITQAQWQMVAGWEPPEGERWEWPMHLEPLSLQRGGQPSPQPPLDAPSHGLARIVSSRLAEFSPLANEAPSDQRLVDDACRAGSLSPFAFGDTITSELANDDGGFADVDGPKGEQRRRTTQVAMFPANAWSFHDMHGTVWEWCLRKAYAWRCLGVPPSILPFGLPLSLPLG